MAEVITQLDMSVLTELKEIMGDDFSLLVETFINDSESRIELIKEAVASGDSDEIRRAAHGFKGSAVNMGAVHLGKLCSSLEHMGKSDELHGAQGLVEEIGASYILVAPALKEIAITN